MSEDNNVEDIIRKKREAREAEEQAAIDKFRAAQKAQPLRSHDQPEHVIQFFKYEHLSEVLAAISKPFCTLADSVVANLPRNPERTKVLDRLLEAKDAAIRCFISGK